MLIIITIVQRRYQVEGPDGGDEDRVAEKVGKILKILERSQVCTQELVQSWTNHGTLQTGSERATSY